MGLQKEDLIHMVYDIFEIDSFASKMGSDEDIVTLSFSVKEHEAAKDLENFIEKGYPFVLDADVTAGEQSDGTYKVFVELERDKDAPMQILEVVEGIKRLTGLENIKFRYYKNFRSMDADADNLAEQIPVDTESYTAKKEGTQLENYKHFFNKSFLESVDMLDNELTIKKKWADPLKFRVLDFGKTSNINITEAFDVNGYPEIIYLTKVLGDYNIAKYNTNTIVLENNGYSLILRRT